MLHLVQQFVARLATVVCSLVHAVLLKAGRSVKAWQRRRRRTRKLSSGFPLTPNVTLETYLALFSPVVVVVVVIAAAAASAAIIILLQSLISNPEILKKHLLRARQFTKWLSLAELFLLSPKLRR